jgi:hypothetical protein
MRSLKYTPLVIGLPYIAATALLTLLGQKGRVLAYHSSSLHPLFGVSFTISRALFVVLVTVIANTVFAYADGSMRNEPNVKKFLASSTIFFLATYAMVFSPSLLQFAIATTISTVGLGYAAFLIPFQDRSKSPRYPWHLHVGDLILLTISVATYANSNQRTTQIALIIWTFSRAGLLPFSRWVVSSVNAPTAASVMIHGGYVNAPAIALIYFASNRMLDIWALVVIVILAIATIVWSSLAKSFAKDAKGRLAVSTCGQMSFMVLEILAGLPILGLFHAVGHGLFKSYLLYDAPSDPFNKSELLSEKATKSRGSVIDQRALKVRNTFRAIFAAVISLTVMIVTTLATGSISIASLSSLIPETVGLAIALYVSINVSFGHRDRVGATITARVMASSIVVAPWLIFIVISKVAANHIVGFERVRLGVWIPALLSLLAPIAIKKSSSIDKLALGHLLHRSYAASSSSLSFGRKLKSARIELDSIGDLDAEVASLVNESVATLVSEIALSLPTVNFVAVNPYQSQVGRNFIDIATPNRDLPLPSLSTLSALYAKGEISPDHISAAVEDSLALYPELIPFELQSKSALEATVKEALTSKMSRIHREVQVVGVKNKARIEELVEEVSILLMDAMLEDGKVIDDDKSLSFRVFELTLGHNFVRSFPFKYTTAEDLYLVMRFKIAQATKALGANDDDRVMKLIEIANDLIPGWLTLLNRSNDGGIGDKRRNLGVASLIFALLFTALALKFDYEELIGDARKSQSADSKVIARSDDSPQTLPVEDTVGDLARTEDAVRIVAQRALEITYQSGLVNRISNNAVSAPLERTNSIDMLFCIDVRSEPMRRLIEEEYSDVRTFGIAGFFGLPFRVRQATPSTLRAPILLDPQRWARIKRVVPSSEELLNDVAASYELLDRVPSLSLVTAEVIGGYMGLASFLKTNFPNFFAKIRTNKSVQKADLEALRSIELEEFNETEIEEVTYVLATTLKSIGLVKDFADAIVLVGHQSSNVNQLHRMAYQCGACGGNSGAENATLVSKLLNSGEIRSRLNSYGIQIPSTTKFVSAIHDTTQAKIEIISSLEDTTTVTLGLSNLVAEINQSTKVTSKFANLNGLPRHREVRSNWWFEGWPEMGLANAASFIIAPREMTRGMDLGGRSFLQSYDLRFDPDGSALESIMSAPLVVGEMISKSYFFAALDGSAITSNKTLLNPISNLGAISGTSGDLIGGLARQAYVTPEGQLAHLPLRLTGIIYANKETVASIVTSNQLLLETVANRWMHILVLDSSDGRFYDVYNLLGGTAANKGDDPIAPNQSFEPTA